MANVAVVSSQLAAAPSDYKIPGAQELLPYAVSASFDGTSAVANFFPCLQIIDPAGHVMVSCVSQSAVVAGGTADVSWFPGLGTGGAAGSAILHLLDLVDFAPVGGKLQITATSGNTPDTVVTGGAVTYDGATQIKIDFYAANIDLDQRGKTGLGSVLLELWIDSTAIGVLFAYNVNAGDYGDIPVYVSAIDTPPAGSHTYSIRAWQEVSGGTIGNSFIYGTGIVTPHATRPGFMAIFAAAT